MTITAPHDVGDIPAVTIDGEQTTARILGLEEEHVEDLLAEQLQEMVDHEAFQGDIRVMPDTHPGAGAVIGFTMPLETEPLRVCPNVVGVDIGCGMLAVKLDISPDVVIDDPETVDDTIREVVPTGRSVHDSTEYNMGDDFPWSICQRYWDSWAVESGLDLDDPDWFEGYDLDSYLKPLCERVGYDPARIINSMGTLGRGNHFIEVGLDDSDGVWLVIHSGSRGIGKAIADYWQDEAARMRTNEWIRSQLDEVLEPYVVPELDDPELSTWFMGGMGKSYIDSEAIRADVDNNYLVGYLHDQIRKAHPQHRNANEDLDYLEDQEAAGYLVDMLFAQTYASRNRTQMAHAITDALDAEVVDEVHSPHNLISWEDRIIRKGATGARGGERFVLPFNMADGTYICRGRGNRAWNCSAPHGAGRVMSRTRAFNELDFDEFEARMEDVYSSSVTEETLDEAPMAYKNAALIQDAIGPTADVLTHVDPVLNVKSLE